MKRQAGAALLAAMLTVTLVATFSAAALWQQWRAIEVERAERTRVQSSWILAGALDWARLILREDARAGNADHLAEPWAVPLQEARLSTFLAADRENTVEGTDADDVFLSGQIADLQSHMNVTNLVQAAVVQDKALESFRRLFDVLGLPQAELARMAENLRFASDISTENRNAARAPLLPQRVEQLVWLGLSEATAAALAPHVAVLPTATPLNVNTASAQALYATLRNVSLADAQRLVAARERQHFRSVADVAALLSPEATIPDNSLSLSSRFFEVRGRLRIDRVVIEERSIVQRDGLQVRTLQRERGVPEPAPQPR